MKKLIAFVIIYLISSLSLALGKPEIQFSAQNFLDKTLLSNNFQHNNFDIKSIETSTDFKFPVYIVHLYPQGFLLFVEGQNLDKPVAYSVNSNWDPDSNNPFISFLKNDLQYFNSYSNQFSISTLLENNNHVNDLESWPPVGSTSTGGWMETTWHQKNPYNQFCPMDTFTNKRSITGCVATAMAQIVQYHRFIGDFQLSPNDRYITGYRKMRIDQDSEVLDFKDFSTLNTFLIDIHSCYESGTDLTTDQIAALNFVCGILVKMDFTSDVSGAALADVDSVLTFKFGYSSANFSSYSDVRFYDQLIEHMMNALPVPISLGAHIAVVDGYNTDGFFHMNFGWGSGTPAQIQECWYLLPEGMPYQYDKIYSAVFNIKPSFAVNSTLSVSDSLLYFDSTLLNTESKIMNFNIINSGDEAVKIDKITVSDYFQISLDAKTFSSQISEFSIPPLHNIELNVRCIPDSFGLFEGKIEILSTENNLKRYKTVDLACYGVPDNRNVIFAGNINGVWEKDSHQYIIGDLDIITGDSLIIEPGVKVEFQGPYNINVGSNAKLIARGAALDTIKFFSENVQIGWKGINLLSSADDDSFFYCDFQFSKNTGENGGAFQLDSTDAFFSNCNFKNNTAENGGAVYCSYSKPEFYQCSFINNTARLGGALYSVVSNIKIQQTLICNNSVTINGGGIFSYDSDLSLINVTISHNNAIQRGGGLTIDGGEKIFINNTILYSNNASNLGHNLYLLDNHWNSTVIEFAFCNIDRHSESSFYDFTYSNNMIMKWNYGNIDVDPLFVNPDNHDYHLQPISKCIDAGNPSIDVGFEPFPHGYCTNLGAYGRTDQAATTDSPRLAVDPFPILFDNVNVDSLNSLKVYLKNGCNENLVINNISNNNTDIYSLSLPQEYNDNGKLTIQSGSIDSLILILDLSDSTLTSVDDSVFVQLENAPDISIPVICNSFLATTIDSGDVSGVWTLENSPYIINDYIFVKQNDSLKIEPGVTVYFSSNASLNVFENSKLIANGTTGLPITFTAIDSSLGWDGFAFRNSGNDDSLTFCNISNIRWDYTGHSMLYFKYGAISFRNSKPFISHCNFFKINSDYLGVFYNNQDSLSLNYCSIYENFSTGQLFDNKYSQLICNHVLIYKNSVQTVFYNHTGDLLLNNCVISNNIGEGAYNDFSQTLNYNSIDIKNSIIWNNFELPIINPGNRDTVLVEYSCVDTSFSEWILIPVQYQPKSRNIVWGKGNVFTNPLFVDSEYNDFRLMPDSPCIDGGDPADNHGNEPFPHGYRINMGFWGGTEYAIKTQGPLLTAAPDPIHFNRVDPSCEHQKNLYLKNGSEYDIQITDLALLDTTFFQLTDDLGSSDFSTNFTLHSGDIDSFSILFNSMDESEFSCSSEIYLSSVECGNDTIDLLAETLIGSKISNKYVSGIWTQENSPYNILTDIEIPDSLKLVIEPGVIIKFLGPISLIINKDSQFLAKGKPDNNIIFLQTDSLIQKNCFKFLNSGVDDTLEYCTFKNFAYNAPQYNALFYLYQTGAVFKNVDFYNNYSNTSTGLICCDKSDAIFLNCKFIDNKSELKGIIYANSANILLKNTLFNNNYSYETGGVAYSNNSNFDFINCTIYKNGAKGLGGVVHCNLKNSLNFQNSIIWGNFAAKGSFIYSNATTEINTNFCCIDSSAKLVDAIGSSLGQLNWGEGNIYGDPLFTNTENNDFTLSENSPCIDVGDPDLLSNDIEDPSTPGMALKPAMGTIRNDMGMYGGDPKAYIATGVDKDVSSVPEKFALMQNYPNPFNGHTVIEFHLPKSVNLRVEIFNTLGQKVTTLADTRYDIGKHKLIWDGSNDNGVMVSSGIYLYRVVLDDSQSIIKRLVFLK